MCISFLRHSLLYALSYTFIFLHSSISMFLRNFGQWKERWLLWFSQLFSCKCFDSVFFFNFFYVDTSFSLFSVPRLPHDLKKNSYWIELSNIVSLLNKKSKYILPLFTNPSARAGYDTRSILRRSLAGLNSVFFLLDELPHQGWRTQSALLFTHSWREDNWNHTFPKAISAIWNAISAIWIAISLVRDLNSCHRVHFERR